MPSTRQIVIQWISVCKTNYAIHWIVIYPVDSVIHPLKNQIQGPSGGTRNIHEGGGGGGGSDGASYCKPKKIHKPEILDSKKYLASKFPTQKMQDLNA